MIILEINERFQQFLDELQATTENEIATAQYKYIEDEELEVGKPKSPKKSSTILKQKPKLSPIRSSFYAIKSIFAFVNI